MEAVELYAQIRYISLYLYPVFHLYLYLAVSTTRLVHTTLTQGHRVRSIYMVI
uniref:Uncharacterized protein n=1 Tax=Picea sitchensis TaxID=3332 RepID=D5AB73_PICSI|nr:unknown [Picea sitchensis]